MTARAKIVLHLVPVPAGPDDPPVEVRLRIVLKRLLRGYGFRCTAALLENPGLAARQVCPDGREESFPEEK